MKKTIKINGIKYERQNMENEMNYVIIRTYSAGVHAGYLKEKEPGTMIVSLVKARRIWKWEGAFTLNEMASFGVEKPKKCRFSCPVEQITLDAIEIIYTTSQGQKNIQGVPNDAQ